MKSCVSLLLALCILSSSALAFAQSEGDYDHDVAVAGANYRAALKAKNPGEISTTHEELRAAHEKLTSYNQLLAGEHLRPAAGETRGQQLALLRAQSDYRDAIDSGSPTTIAQAKEALRLAYEQHWALSHSRSSHVAPSTAGKAKPT